MMKKLIAAFSLLLLFAPVVTHAQLFKKISFSGMYVQWGYNRDWFSKSTLHFKNGDKYDFTIHDVSAHDNAGYHNILENPLQISIPQNSIRAGFYLNEKHTHAIEINFDHTKYIVSDQRARITGDLGGETMDKDTMVALPFLHLEHTNGANFFLINYVSQYQLWSHKNMQATAIWKAGAGIVIPRSDVTIMGERLDNVYHIAGYIAAAEGGFRFYPLKKWFVELTCKGGFANYLNALTVEGGSVKHHFYFGEVIGLVGYDIDFRKKKRNTTPTF